MDLHDQRRAAGWNGAGNYLSPGLAATFVDLVVAMYDFVLMGSVTACAEGRRLVSIGAAVLATVADVDRRLMLSVGPSFAGLRVGLWRASPADALLVSVGDTLAGLVALPFFGFACVLAAASESTQASISSRSSWKEG